MRPNFFHHIHPPTIPARQARLRYTLAAGGLAVFFLLVLVVTGLLEMFYYIPTPEQAGTSIQTLTFLIPYGGLVRNLHYWAAQLLVVVTVIHLLRVILTGSYSAPRRFNYLLGIGLLVLMVLLDFTGYMLRWDEGIRWALVAGTNLVKTIPMIGPGLYTLLVGGSQPGQATLIRFYGWHIYGLMIVSGILVVWHIFRVRRDGGIAVPPPPLRVDQKRITRFELVRREVLSMLLASVALLLLSVFATAPLASPITGTASLAGTARAPWFFLWVQELLKLGSPFLWGVVVPLAVITVVAFIPYFLPGSREAELGEWFPRGARLAQGLVILLLLSIVILSILALQPIR